jgi:SAM-dependent methyltransferase
MSEANLRGVTRYGATSHPTARWLHDQGFDVMATDLSPAHVERILAKGVRAEVRDMLELGFAGGSFDGVWAASCLMHVADADLPRALQGIRDVVRPGGWFWAGTWGGHDQEGRWEEDTHEPKRFYSHRSHERLRSFYDPWFEIVSFEAFSPEDSIAWEYQSALMRRPV